MRHPFTVKFNSLPSKQFKSECPLRPSEIENKWQPRSQGFSLEAGWGFKGKALGTRLNVTQIKPTRGGEVFLPEICPFPHSSLHQNRDKLCITVKLINCKLPNCYFNAVSIIVTSHRDLKVLHAVHSPYALWLHFSKQKCIFTCVLKKTKVSLLRKRRLRWLGHIPRICDVRIP